MARGYKRKVYADEDDLNDGSHSDDSAEGYVPPLPTNRVSYIPHQSVTVMAAGRARSSKSLIATPASPTKKILGGPKTSRAPPPQAPDPGPDASQDWDGDFADFDAEYGPGLQKPPRALRDSDNPHAQWARDDREEFLDELVRHDGRGDYVHQAVCAGVQCEAPRPVYRCYDCFHPCLYCEACVKAMHEQMPLHHLERWNGRSMERCTLRSLGVRIQLGHPPGVPCPNPERAWGDDFVIISSRSIDAVGLDYCNCATAKPKHLQLLRMRLYPATTTNPRSAATFAVLRRFAHMTFESKCSGYEFYNSLVHETNNTGLDPSRERYDEFLRMTRQWQHLMLLKRGGRAHDPGDDRINTTKPGELALLCPACPQPGKNLPADWEKVPFEKAFIFALFLALDANFRLQRKDVSTEERDPGLSQGWAFFGEVTKYMDHLARHWDQQQERSTCVAHDAVDKPDREALGTASSGIATVDCARHNMKRPNGVGDLQKGERYLNMDYIFFTSLVGIFIWRMFVSYDIACQWYKNLSERMRIFDPDVQFKQDEKHVVFLVPKFHLPAHIEQCNIDFSFNLTPGVGRTDGEAPERGWADANRLSNSTRVSGPGARRDTLDAHFQYSNWKKIVKLGAVLLDKLQKAVPLMLDTREAWVDVEASFPPIVIQTWTAMAVAWEADNARPNPFASEVKRDDLRAVRLKLAEVAAADVDHERVRGDMHETEMLSMALKLEVSQRALATHMAQIGLHETADQGRRRIERETKLRRKIDAWIAVQELFMPDVAILRARDEAERKRVGATQPVPGLKAQDMKLWLPSAVGTRVHCDHTLREYEFQLRHGQAVLALDTIRNELLLLRTHEYQYRNRMHGVKAKLRSRTRTDDIQSRINSAAEEYRVARAALVNLSAVLKRKGWEQYLKPLKEQDVRGRPSAVFGDDERRGKNKGRKKTKKARLDLEGAAGAETPTEPKQMSWIWLSEGTTGTAEDVVESEPLRIEWAKTRAKAMRYAEEVDLLEEEMRRVLQFMDWRADWWMALVGLRAGKQDEALREGHEAYAVRQAGYMRGIRDRFAAQWKDTAKFIADARERYAEMKGDDLAPEGEGGGDDEDEEGEEEEEEGEEEEP
ncbi:hypothetical protein B0H14DRAFT_3509403 [Mycena olivaceomarginata]|nr:hypothetical protein B0H14DRAFT_3509403 [Mycena olivaceomarginata]